MVNNGSLQDLVNKFSSLPGIGPKTAERLVYFLLLRPEQELNEFGDLLKKVKQNVTECEVCQNFTQTSPCYTCNHPKRRNRTICIVAKPQDINALEKANEYDGIYYVLGGTVNPIEGIRIENLKVRKLKERIEQKQVEEIILAFNPDLDGEATTLSITKFIKTLNNSIKITKLARGLPMGSDLEYADEVTLKNALKGRRDI